MRKSFPAEDLARDGRFRRARMEDRFEDPRNDTLPARRRGKLTPERPDAAHAARQMMHGIFVGEIQALEGAGRTVWDFDDDDAPFALKLDMARQCWDEARHTEISVKLGEWMGTEVGEFAETTFLYQAACNPDPVLRLTGVNRALEGLAIDVFNTMREFGEASGDCGNCDTCMVPPQSWGVPYQFQILQGERRQRALEFQRVVDKLFSFRGFRGEAEDNPIQLARTFRRMAGFDDAEIDEIAEASEEADVSGSAEVFEGRV